MTPVNRVVGAAQLVDELHLTFTTRADAVVFAERATDAQKDRRGCRGGRKVSW